METLDSAPYNPPEFYFHVELYTQILFYFCYIVVVLAALAFYLCSLFQPRTTIVSSG